MGKQRGRKDQATRKWENLINTEIVCVLGLLTAAIALYLSGIDNVALRDWDEGIVAGVARNIWRSFPDGNTWLYPTINYNDPYWNKPPLVHWLVAFSYSLFGVNEGSTRLFPALLSAITVPLLYKIGREIKSDRSTAIFSALVYLTLLPIARHGRVAMLDGAVNCWFCLGVWCLLRGRKDRRWLLGTGLGIGAICLTKGMMMGVLLGGIIIIFLLWDSPKILLNPYFITSLILGTAPAIAWYLLQYLHYGQEFLGISLGKQTFNRIWQPVSNVSSPPWYYLLEIAKYSLPWLIFLPYGIQLAWKNRDLSWGRLTLIWSGVYLLAISLMVTKLPWYVMPIYPGLSLLIGAGLATAWQSKQYLLSWKISLSILTAICSLAVIYLSISGQLELDLIIILGIVIVSLAIATILLWSNGDRAIPTLIGGFYLGLLLFFNSNHWLWELNEAFPTRKIAAEIKQHTPAKQIVYTAYPNFRPALNFYSDRNLIPADDTKLKQTWQQNQPAYLLLDTDAIDRLDLRSYITLSKKIDGVTWQLISNQ